MTTKVNYEKKIIERSYGMATVIWGPLFWSFMNDIANIYDHHWLKWDIVTREKMESFWKILCSVLPCRYISATKKGNNKATKIIQLLLLYK